MAKVSIIIPVYNVAAYVSDCIDSVINQSYRDLEIIIVNDGSTDNSAEICVQKAQLDSRIIYLEKENGGLSSARNHGLRNSTGEFVYLLDSDDFLVKNAIEVLIGEQARTKADIVSSDFDMINENTKLIDAIRKADFIRGGNELFFCQIITNQACAKLYKRELFEDILYPIGVHYEDVATTFKLYDRAKCVSHTQSGLYCYRVRSGAITNKVNKKDIDDLWSAYYAIKTYYNNPNEDQQYYEMTVLYTIYSRLLRSNCHRVDFKDYENKIYFELKSIKLDIGSYRNKSPVYYKIKIFNWHLAKYVVRLVDFVRMVKLHRNKVDKTRFV